MLQFLAILIQATELSGADLVVFFNGCNEVPRRSEWIQQQLQMRNKVNNVCCRQYKYKTIQLLKQTKKKYIYGIIIIFIFIH